MAELKKPNHKPRTVDLRTFNEIKNKVLIFNDKGGLGDVLMQRMLFNDLRKLLPGAELTLACLPEYMDSAVDHPNIDNVVDSRTVNHDQYMVSFNTCVTIADRYESNNVPNCKEHRSDIWANYFGLELTEHDMNFVVDKKKREESEELLAQYRKPGKPLIGLAPTSKMLTKSLTPQQIGWIHKRLKDYGLVSFHKGDIPSCRSLGIPVIGDLGAQDLIACFDCLDYVISVDTASFHLAGGLRKPLVGIFTFADGKAYGKYYDFVLVQKHRDNGDWDCGPCFKFCSCPKTKKPIKPCLTEITEAEIVHGIDAMFGKWNYENKTN